MGRLQIRLLWTFVSRLSVNIKWFFIQRQPHVGTQWTLGPCFLAVNEDHLLWHFCPDGGEEGCKSYGGWWWLPSTTNQKSRHHLKKGLVNRHTVIISVMQLGRQESKIVRRNKSSIQYTGEREWEQSTSGIWWCKVIQKGVTGMCRALEADLI